MKYTLDQFKALISELTWSPEELADHLSVIGHETEVSNQNDLNVTITSNRSDCKDLRYLVFDLAGIYNLKTTENLITVEPGITVEVGLDFINKLLGSNISEEQYHGLSRLGFQVTSGGVTVPEFRHDISTAADIAEEVIRLAGYSSLHLAPLTSKEGVLSPSYQKIVAVKTALVGTGLTETITSSFSAQGEVELKNPFATDQPYMRASLLEGLLRTLARNPYLKRALFFEIGSVFTPEETTCLGLFVAGYKNIDYIGLSISQALGVEVKFTSVDEPTCTALDVKQSRVQWCQIPLDKLSIKSSDEPQNFNRPLPQFQAISKYPPLVRDATITTAESNAPNSTIITQAFVANFPELLLIELIDTYHDAEAQKTTLTFRLIFQKMDSSFTQDEITTIDARLAEAVSVIEKKVT